MSIQHRHEVEDNALDVVRKAMSGLTADGFEWGKALHDQIKALSAQMITGKFLESDWIEVACKLQLHGPSLLSLARDPTVPKTSVAQGWQCWNLPFGPYSVNAYLLPTDQKSCILIDAGFDWKPFMHRVNTSGSTPTAILITHNHRDHVGALPALLQQYPKLKVYAMYPELCLHTKPLVDGVEFELNGIQIRALHTPGHAPDGISFEIRQHDTVAIAGGDSIYARSAGKIPQDYQKSLNILKNKVLRKPADTLLLPGHGPITTVGSECAHNPFFAENT